MKKRPLYAHTHQNVSISSVQGRFEVLPASGREEPVFVISKSLDWKQLSVTYSLIGLKTKMELQASQKAIAWDNGLHKWADLAHLPSLHLLFETNFKILTMLYPPITSYYNLHFTQSYSGL